MTKKTLTYKDAIEKIEKILIEMENEDIDIDNLSSQVKKVNELLLFCKEKLTKTEAEVEKIFSELNL